MKALVDWVLINGSSLLYGVLLFVGIGLVLTSGPAKRVWRAIDVSTRLRHKASPRAITT